MDVTTAVIITSFYFKMSKLLKQYFGNVEVSNRDHHTKYTTLYWTHSGNEFWISRYNEIKTLVTKNQAHF